MKPKKEKSLKTKNNFKRRFEFLKKNKISFTMLLSNYTSEIEVLQAPELNYKEVSDLQSNRAFIGAQMIIKDLKTWTANDEPLTERDNAQYFDVDADAFKHLSEGGKLAELHNIDLKSAYLTVLYNNYFISKKTYDYIINLSKKERLVAVGMLASRKDKYYFSEGELSGMELIKKDTENYFYYCVFETYKIINNLREIIGYNFVFSWVDSIYFFDLNGGTREKIEKYLKSINFEFSYKKLEGVKMKEKKDSFFIQYGNDEEKNYFNIPKNKKGFKYDLLKQLNLIN